MFDNVLVIDDDPVFCELLNAYAEQAGVKSISFASDGRDALGILQQKSNQTDFIVLDLNMPDINGVELLDKFKEMSFSRPLAIVSSEELVIIDMAATLGQQYGLNIIDAVKKPLTKDVVERWFGRNTVAEDDNQDRRRAARLNIDIDAVIKCSERSTPLACTVRDFSQTGARLQAESDDRIPDRFCLYFEHEGISAECEVVWRSETEVGVTFQSAPEV